MTDGGRLNSRLAFYAHHQELIEEWLNCRDEFRRETHQFYCRLPVEGPGGTKPIKGKHKSGIRKWHWLSVGNWNGAELRLEWNDETTFTNGHLRLGIWKSRDGQPDLSKSSDVLNALSPQWEPAGASPWAIYINRESMPVPEGDYWNDLESYRRKLAEFVTTEWETLTKAMDRSFRGQDGR